MQGYMHKISTTVSVVTLAACLGIAMPLSANAAEDADIAKGKELAFDRKKVTVWPVMP